MFKSGKLNWCTVAALFALLSLVPFAGADISDTILTVTANDGRTEGTIYISQADGYWDGDDFFWSFDDPDNPMEIRDPDDQLLGTLTSASLAFYADPQVALGFAVQAEDENTTFTITSALLSFATIPSAFARADAALTLQDFFGTGALLTGNGPLGGAYLTQYNGFVPDGTSFAEAIDQIEVIPPDMLATADFASAEPGEYLPIGTASNMSSQFAFTLSPQALASGSANFEIIPEPATLLLVLAGLIAARRR
jgi:hypothetical protein